jgi:hypothetical protein
MLEGLGVSGIGINGKFCNPGLIANMLPGTLDKMDQKLSKDQEDSLYEIGQRYIEEDGLRQGAYGEESYRLKQFLDETALKDRFFTEVYGLLSDTQLNTLRPESTRGYTSVDMLSSAVQWGPVVRPVPLENRDQLANRMTGLVLEHLGVDASMRDSVHGLTTEWATRIPDSLLQVENQAVSKFNWHQVDRVRAFATEQLKLFETMVQQLNLPPETAAKIRNEVIVAVPYVTGAKG